MPAEELGQPLEKLRAVSLLFLEVAINEQGATGKEQSFAWKISVAASSPFLAIYEWLFKTLRELIFSSRRKAGRVSACLSIRGNSN